jgi:hypothetical protein
LLAWRVWSFATGDLIDPDAEERATDQPQERNDRECSSDAF